MKIKFTNITVAIATITTLILSNTLIGSAKPEGALSPSSIDRTINLPAARLTKIPNGTIYGQFKWTGDVPANTRCQDLQVQLVSYEQVTPPANGDPNQIALSQPLFKYNKKLSTVSANSMYAVSTSSTPGTCHYSVTVDKKYIGQGAKLSFSAPAGGADSCSGRPQNEAVSVPKAATELNVEVGMLCNRV
jgi:hypothetical protein